MSANDLIQFDPFAPTTTTTSSATTNATTSKLKANAPPGFAGGGQAKNKTLFNPFLQSGPVESPKLMRRVMRSAGIAPPPEEKESDDEADVDEWSDDDEAAKSAKQAAHKKEAEQRKQQSLAESAKRRESSKGDVTPLPAAELLKRWKQQQVDFIQATSTHPDIVTLDFQRAILKAGVFEACTGLIEDPETNRLSLLYALGLLKRLTSKNGAISSIKFSQTILRRLCEEAAPDCDDPRIRAFAITLLAAMENKKQLEELGFYENCIKYCSPGQAANSPLVENALAIALVNFSLDVARQRRILDTITMARLTQWAKSLEPDLKTCAAAFIGNLVANEDVKLQIIHDGGLTILIKLMAAPGAPGYKEHAARGLANLALHDEAHLPMLERGVLQILSRVVLEEPPSSVPTLRSALRCIAHLSISDRTGPAIAEYMQRSRDFANRVNDLAGSDNEELAKHAEKTLQNIALHSKNKSSSKKKRTTELVEQLLERRPSLDDLGSWNIYKEPPPGAVGSTSAFSSPVGNKPAPSASASAAPAAAKSPRGEPAASAELESDEESDDEADDDERPTLEKTTIRLDTGERRDSFGDLAARHKTAKAKKSKSPLSPRGAGSDARPLSPRGEPEDDDDEGLIGGAKKVVKKVTRRNKPVHV